MKVLKSSFLAFLLAILCYLFQFALIETGLTRLFARWELLSVLFLVVFLSANLIDRLSKKQVEPKTKVFYSLVKVGVKMVLHLLIILIYFLPTRSLSVDFIIHFFSIFIFFSGLDLHYLLKSR